MGGSTRLVLRTAVRTIINDPEPQRIPNASTTFTHDGGNGSAYFEDASENFVTHGVEVGMVLVNVTDNYSEAVIKAIAAGAGTNARLIVQSIEGGTENDYDNNDVVQIWDRYAQEGGVSPGQNRMRYSNAEVHTALGKAEKAIAQEYKAIEKTSITADILEMTKIDMQPLTGNLAAGDVVTGGTNGHKATVYIAGGDFILIHTMLTKIDIDTKVGTLLPGEEVVGGTTGYRATIYQVNTNDIFVYNQNGTFQNDETLTGASSGATCAVNEPSGYSSALFVVGETLTGSPSGGTAKVVNAYGNGNFNVGQDLPSDVLEPRAVSFWDGSRFRPITMKQLEEMLYHSMGSGNPQEGSIWAGRVLLWPHYSAIGNNLLRFDYWGWPTAMTADTSTTEIDYRYERLLTLQAGKFLVEGREPERLAYIEKQIEEEEKRVMKAGKQSTGKTFREEVNWDSYRW